MINKQPALIARSNHRKRSSLFHTQTTTFSPFRTVASQLKGLHLFTFFFLLATFRNRSLNISRTIAPTAVIGWGAQQFAVCYTKKKFCCIRKLFSFSGFFFIQKNFLASKSVFGKESLLKSLLFKQDSITVLYQNTVHLLVNKFGQAKIIWNQKKQAFLFECTKISLFTGQAHLKTRSGLDSQTAWCGSLLARRRGRKASECIQKFRVYNLRLESTV